METTRTPEVVSAPAEPMEGLEVANMAIHYPQLPTVVPSPTASKAENSDNAFLADLSKSVPLEQVQHLDQLRAAEATHQAGQLAALRAEVREDLGNVKYPATLARLREHVRAYADAHALATKIGRLERRAYRRDIYDFGRLIGLKRREARRERARYRIEMGRVVDDSDESDLEDAFDEEEDDQIARAKPVDPEFDSELRRLMGKCVGVKRKRDDGEEESQSKLSEEQRTLRRAAKKARKAANKQKNISASDSHAVAPMTPQKQVAPKTPQKLEQGAQEASKLSESARKARKAAKKARKAAELAARNAVQKSAPVETKKAASKKVTKTAGATEIVTSGSSKQAATGPTTAQPDAATDKSEKSKRKRERKKAKKAAGAAGSVTSGSSKEAVTVPTTANNNKNNTTAEKKTSSVPSKEKSKEQQDQTITENASTDGPKESKRIRKRKRNNNLLKENDTEQAAADAEVVKANATEPATEAEARKNYAASNQKENQEVTKQADPKPVKKQKLSAMEAVVEQMKEEARLNEAKALEAAKAKDDVDMGGMDARDAELDLQVKVEDKLDQKQIETAVQEALLEDKDAAKERGTFDAQTGKTVSQMKEEREAAILEENGAAKPLEELDGDKNRRRSRGKGRKSISAENKVAQEDQEMADSTQPVVETTDNVFDKVSPHVEEPTSKDQDTVMEDAPEANVDVESQKSRHKSKGKGRRSTASIAEIGEVEQPVEAAQVNIVAESTDIPVETAKVEPVEEKTVESDDKIEETEKSARRSRGKGRKSSASIAEIGEVEQPVQAAQENIVAESTDIPIDFAKVEPVEKETVESNDKIEEPEKPARRSRGKGRKSITDAVEPVESAQPVEVQEMATEAVKSAPVSTGEEQAVENTTETADNANAKSLDDAYLADTNTPKSTGGSQSKQRKSDVSTFQATKNVEEPSYQDNEVPVKELAQESSEKTSDINDVQVQPPVEEKTVEPATESVTEAKMARRTRAKARKSKDAKEVLGSSQEESPAANTKVTQEERATEENPAEAGTSEKAEPKKTTARAPRRKAPAKSTAASEAKTTPEESASDNAAAPVKALKPKALAELKNAEANVPSSPVRRSARRVGKTEEQSKENHSDRDGIAGFAEVAGVEDGDVDLDSIREEVGNSGVEELVVEDGDVDLDMIQEVADDLGVEELVVDETDQEENGGEVEQMVVEAEGEDESNDDNDYERPIAMKVESDVDEDLGPRDDSIHVERHNSDAVKSEYDSATEHAWIPLSPNFDPYDDFQVTIYSPKKTLQKVMDTTPKQGIEISGTQEQVATPETSPSKSTLTPRITRSVAKKASISNGPPIASRLAALRLEQDVTASASSQQSVYYSADEFNHVSDSEVSEFTPVKKEHSKHLSTSIQELAPFEDITPAKASTRIKKEKAGGSPVKSPFFPSPEKEKKQRIPGGTVSCIPFPPLSADHFGLLQEKVSDQPYWLLVGVALLNRTTGKKSIPAFFQLRARYPTIEDMANANKRDIIDMTRHLGFSNQRTDKFIALAKRWLEDPPVCGVRRRKLHYPNQGDGKDIKVAEVLDDADPRSAWEIVDYPSVGAYALDSWRIFCRDKLRGVADGYDGEGAAGDFEPEWMRVLPMDKELRAYLRWKWLKEGFSWDPFTGEKEVADQVLLDAAKRGDVVWDDDGGIKIKDEKTIIVDEGSSVVALRRLEEEGVGV